jgi:glycosyltransferase involved in cell wall biosynthesis
VAGNKPWVFALANALGHEAPAHATTFCDWRVYWRHAPSWPDPDAESDLECTTRVFPTGYAGTLEPLFRPYLRSLVRRWDRELASSASSAPWVVTTRPYTAPWLEAVPDERLIYYNLDDYALYRPERADKNRRQEETLLRRARLTICLSQTQVEALSGRHPDRADQIRHFPLGVSRAFLNPEPEAPPDAKTVGYVGNLGDRVDWPFVDAVAERCPNLRFVFVGRAEDTDESEEWIQARSRVLARENVEHVGYVPQQDVPRYYWSFATTWIPYDTDHPFNRAACPTKIMDGLGSGRPVVSTSVPECTLYPDWIDIADTPVEMADRLHERAARHDPERARAQVNAAAEHVWPERARTLRRWLS